LQHLGQVGFHALALAGGQDHDGQGHGDIHLQELRRILPEPGAATGGATALQRDARFEQA
jgi:hypothetical protein